MAAGGNRNILIVEDDREFRQTLAEQLRLHEEFDVEEAGTGADAVAGAGEGLLARESVGQESCTDMRKRARLCIERGGGHMDHRTGRF